MNIKSKLIYLAFYFLLIAGCKKGVGYMDRMDRENFLIKRAISLRQAGDNDSAIELFREALLLNPRLGWGHIELALLLHDRVSDKEQKKVELEEAIYHYRMYLKLRPDTEKKAIIEERLKKAEQVLGSLLISAEKNLSAVEMDKILNENRMLKERISQLESMNQSLRDSIAKMRMAQLEEIKKKEELHQKGIYVVKPGDTLVSIAEEFYGDKGKWRVLYEANKDIIDSTGKLEAGQVLKIP